MCFGKQIVVGKRLEVDCIPLDGLMFVKASDFSLLCILSKGYGILNFHKFNTWYVYLIVFAYENMFFYCFVTSPKSTMEPKHHLTSDFKFLLFLCKLLVHHFRDPCWVSWGVVDKMPFSLHHKSQRITSRGPPGWSKLKVFFGHEKVRRSDRVDSNEKNSTL